MTKILKSIVNSVVKSFWTVALASLILATNLLLPQTGAVAIAATSVESDVIQPFQLTEPAATRAEAYDEVAKLNNNPKELIAAENKEEQAEEQAYKAEEKGAKSIWGK